MASILITCYSRTGKTKKIAESIGRGAKTIDGVSVDVKSFNMVSSSDLVRYDGIILGSPVYFGSPAMELKELIDESTFVRGKLIGKVGAAFVTAGDRTGGKETAILTILQAMLIHGMVVVGDPINPDFENSEHNGGHYGFATDGPITDTDIQQAELFGKHVATIVKKLFP